MQSPASQASVSQCGDRDEGAVVEIEPWLSHISLNHEYIGLSHTGSHVLYPYDMLAPGWAVCQTLQLPLWALYRFTTYNIQVTERGGASILWHDPSYTCMYI